MKTLLGIDVSNHNSGLDYTNLAKSISFVVPQSSYGTTKNPLFLTHVYGFRAVRTLIPAVYHFIYAISPEQAKRNAEKAIQCVQEAGLPKTTRIWADFEYDSADYAKKRERTIGVAECNEYTRIFCETVTKAGYPTGIYCNIDFYENWYSKELRERYPIWLCDLSKSPKYSCMMWQYSWDGFDWNIWFQDDELLDSGELTTVEKAIQWMENLAKDDSHGYDQIYRWGEKGDYDCSSAVISAWRQAGVPLTCTYTGNMKADMLKHGFRIVQDGSLKRGDVLLNEVHHTAMYCGNGLEVEASINEKGTAVWGVPGDQTGKEILIRPYRDYPWDYVLRYESVREDEYMFQTETVRKGSKGASVLLLQKLLKAEGYTGSNGAVLALDSDFGGNTEAAVKEYQRKHTGLAVDGICGVNTWKSIVGL